MRGARSAACSAGTGITRCPRADNIPTNWRRVAASGSTTSRAVERADFKGRRAARLPPREEGRLRNRRMCCDSRRESHRHGKRRWRGRLPGWVRQSLQWRNRAEHRSHSESRRQSFRPSGRWRAIATDRLRWPRSCSACTKRLRNSCSSCPRLPKDRRWPGSELVLHAQAARLPFGFTKFHQSGDERADVDGLGRFRIRRANEINRERMSAARRHSVAIS